MSHAQQSLPYAELHCKSNYSFLEGASHPEELIKKAQKVGLSALAITDRNGVYGVVRTHQAAKRIAFPLIIGSELNLANHTLVLLAASHEGYKNLCRLISIGRSVPKGTSPLITWEDLQIYHQDLFALFPPPYESRELGKAKDIFQERLSIALHRTLEVRDVRLSIEALEQVRRHQIPLLATNDVHYHHPQRQPLQDVLTAIRHRTTVQKAGKLLFSNAERRLKSPKEMAHIFSDHPEALQRSIEIAQACHFSLDELTYVYPDEFLPSGKSTQTYLTELVQQGAKYTYPKGIPTNVQKQLQHELKLIQQLHFEDYFLTIWDIVQFARKRGILCQGRGSAANSAVCYVLGITSIDPVRMNLLFERFISAERGEPPDIDVDFEHERREEIIQYIYERYGRNRAGMVAEVVRYRKRSALREVAKALGIAHLEANRISKSFHRRDHHQPNERFLNEQGINPKSQFSQNLLSLSQQIEGFPRHLSIHTGGFVLTKDPLLESVPIEPARMPGRSIIQWDKNDLAAVGMLKVDVLALGMLTAIRKCFDLILKSTSQELTLQTIPSEDPNVYDMICQADTVGVFQIESRAQMGMLPRLKPRNFHDLVIEVAIVRPGPIQGGMVHPYLKRRRGEEETHYPHPALEPILKKTFGVPLFQEQVMKIAVAIADFNPGEADELRRAMGIWRTSDSVDLQALEKKMVARMKNNGLSESEALHIYGQIKSFGEFGFPESHSASFALLVYASAYLKCYHPAAFACALLNAQPMGFYSPRSILEDAKRHQVKILPIDVQSSEWDCTLENGSLRLGLRLVSHMRKVPVMKMMQERERSPFASLENFVHQTSFSQQELFRLTACGAFSGFEPHRREALWHLKGVSSKRDLYAGIPIQEPSTQFPKLSDSETVAMDYQTTGLSTLMHPAHLFRNEMNQFHVIPSNRLKTHLNGKRIRVGGLVMVRQAPPTAKGMVFLTLEDETGFTNIAIRPDQYAKARKILTQEPFLIIEGKLQRDGLAISVLAHQVWPLPQILRNQSQVLPRNSRDFH